LENDIWKVSEFQDNGQQTTCRKNSEGKTKQRNKKIKNEPSPGIVSSSNFIL